MSPNVYTPSPKFGAPLARRRLRRFAAPALIMCLSVLALWPTAFNRGVFFFVDGFAYVRAGDLAIAKIFPALGPSGLFNTLRPRGLLKAQNAAQGAGRRPEALSPSREGAPEAGAKTVLVDRSVYYGLPADLAYRLGGFWIWALVQAAVGVGLLWLTGAHFGLGAASRAASVLFAITLTSFPLYASLVLPDVWAGYAILSVCVLSVFGKTMSRAETGFHLAVVTFGCLSHNSIILMVLVTGLCGALRAIAPFRRWSRREGRASATASAASRLRLPTVVVVCGLAVAASLAGSEIYAHMVKAVLGASIANPPFMTARLVADGPGRKYLQHHCYGAHFYICEVKTPIAGDSEIFLWGERPDQGGVYLSSPEARKQLSAEDAKFFLAVALRDPVGVFVSSVSNTVRQLVRIEFDSIFRYDDDMKAMGKFFMNPTYFSKFQRSRAFVGAWPNGMIHLEEMMVMVMSYAGLVVMNLRRSLWGKSIRKFANEAFLMVVVNAMVCGCVSGVFGRYQGRIVWVLACVVFMSFLCAPSIRARLERRRPRPAIPGRVPG